jgi:lipid II:glycine glycyltransferase (peptidoglycan interpeptide bridge formation enzyme)
MTASVVLDLRRTEDELLSRMKSNTRKNIHAGLRSGLEIKRHVKNAPELFTDLMWKLCERRGCAPSPPEKDFFIHLQECFEPSQQAHFFFVFLGDEAVSSALVFTVGGWVRGWKVGWSGAYPKKFPNEFLEWELIKWARNAGCIFFDFVGIERNCAEALIAGNTMPDTPYTGINRFKLGFGGKPILLPLPASTVFNPALGALLYSKIFSKLMNRKNNRKGEEG